MKRILLIILIAVTSVIAFGQSRLGHTDKDIIEEYSDSKYELESGYDNEGDFYVSIVTSLAYVKYFFNLDGRCYLVFIAPLNLEILNAYVERYNSDYVIINSKEWKRYTDRSVERIELIFNNDSYFFKWTWIE